METLFKLDFGPLNRVLEDCGHFMYMATYISGAGIEIYTYKHGMNRRYINVDSLGRFYKYQPAVMAEAGDYIEITAEEAFSGFAADGWPLMLRALYIRKI